VKKISVLILIMAAMFFIVPNLAHGQIPGQHILIFPQIAFGGEWFTSVLVTNVTDVPQEFTHGFKAPDGNDLYLTITVGNDGRQVWGSTYSTNPVPPKGSFLITLRSSDQKITTGWMNTWVPVVNGKDALKVQVTYFYAPNGVIEGQASVIPSEPSRNFSFQAVHSGEFSDTGVAIVNRHNYVPATVKMTVHNMAGAVIATVDFTVPVKGQVAKFVTELVPALKTGWSGGLVEFSSDQPVSGMSLLMNGGVFSTGTTFQ